MNVEQAKANLLGWAVEQDAQREQAASEARRKWRRWAPLGAIGAGVVAGGLLRRPRGGGVGMLASVAVLARFLPIALPLLGPRLTQGLAQLWGGKAQPKAGSAEAKTPSEAATAASAGSAAAKRDTTTREAAVLSARAAKAGPSGA